MDLLGGPVGIHNGRPNAQQRRRFPIGIGLHGADSPAIQDFESGLNLLPIPGFDRVKKLFHLSGHLHLMSAGQGMSQAAPGLAEARELFRDNFFGAPCGVLGHPSAAAGPGHRHFRR
jgi:hypothetical protein